METLPETKIQKTGRLGANLAAGDVASRAANEDPKQPANDLRNAETPGGPVPMPEVLIPKTGRLGGNAAAAEANPRFLDDSPEQPASDPRNLATPGGTMPLPDTNIRKTGRLGGDAAAADIVLRSSDEDPDQVASDLRLAEDYAGVMGGPAPPLALVKQYRDSFQQTLQEAKNAKILSEAPVLANWLLSPENTALAGDDVATLAYFERLGEPTAITADADRPRGDAPPAAQPNGNAPAPIKKTALQVLAEEIAGARDKNKDEIAALEDQIDRQRVPDRDIWKMVLKDVRNGTATREDALSILTPGGSSFVLEVKEAAKAIPGAAFGSLGKAVEGVGQLAQPLAGRSDTSARDALIRDIADAKKIGNDSKLVEALNLRISQQSDLPRAIARGAVRDIIDGTATPEEVILQLTPSEALNDFIRAVPATLQKTGEEWQDKGANLYRPTPGMEDGIGWKTGTAIGSALPGAVIGAATGGTGAILYGAAEGAGEAASGARKAGLDEAMQTQRLGWVSSSDLDAAIAAGGDMKIPTATYAAKIAGSEHDAFFTENARLHSADISAKQASDPERRAEEAQKDGEDARVDQQAHEAIEGTAKDAETARVNRKARRFVKEAPGDGEAVNADEQARRAVEGVESDAKPHVASGRRSAPRGSRRSAPSSERKTTPKSAVVIERRSAPGEDPARISKPAVPTSRRSAPQSKQKTVTKPRAVSETRNDSKIADAGERSQRKVKRLTKDTKIVRTKRKTLRPANKLRSATEE
ncbi:hypothetical protein ATY76_04575 [Rhizobium sp. R339]|uniref:hypothetical protein n=1 Tax=Rhizobium sp. R339 TaxID=1764273 RepID=UPI000B5326EC|nr:hypothetical protein [Rhizobium sp. R339]OWV77218.1 hypothetical protein ATY76_04575 [Rhizobium sp. R339]